MKKKAILGSIIIVSIILIFIIKNKNTPNINIIDNNIMNNEFSQTLDSYYSDDEDFEIEIYSAEPTKSALKTISLYNYIHKKVDEIYDKIIKYYLYGDVPAKNGEIEKN